MFNSGVVLSFLSLITALTLAQIDDDLELIQVQIVSRHGLRSPEFPYPNDAYSDQAKYWPDGWGQLTPLGREQSFELGKFIRRRYDSFLSEQFSAQETFAISSDYDRTIQSAQLVLAGLFSTGSNFNIDSIIPTHSIPKGVDRMINPHPNCPKRQELYTEFLNSPEVTRHTTEHKELFDSIRQKMGYGPNDFNGVYNSIGSLMIYRLYNLSLPTWATDLVDSDEFLKIISEGFKFLTGTETLKRLTAGPLLSYMLDIMKGKVNDTDSRKLILILGHDMTISNLMNTLSTFETWPTFSATLFFELYSKKGTKEAILKVSYKNATTSEFIRELNLLKCPSPCTLENFTKGYHHYLPTSAELDVECQLDQAGVVLSTLDTVLIGAIVGLVVLLLVLSAYHFFGHQSNKAYTINT